MSRTLSLSSSFSLGPQPNINLICRKQNFLSPTTFSEISLTSSEILFTFAGFSVQNGLLLYKDKIFLSASSSLKPLVLQYVHGNLIGGHSRYLKTLHRVKRDFFWKGMKSDVKNRIKCCEVCQRIKVDTKKTTRLLQPLPIPKKPWLDISMDFIEGLPKS